ncbi:MAG: dTMP kinase [Myxococcaceae bacterium]
MTAPGLFIVLEGLDGAGTTTQAERLGQMLRKQGRKVLITREPSDGPLGLLIRQALTGRLGMPGGKGPLSQQTLALMFAADRMDHLEAQVHPALQAGVTVICDRYLLSSLAYQGATVPMEWVNELNREATSPDLTLFVGVDVETASKRRAIRGGDPELFDADEKQAKIREQYAEAIKLLQKKERIVHIDGTAGIDDVTDACWAEIAKLLPKG